MDARDPVWPFTSYLQLEIRGDSSLVVNWANAVWACMTGHVNPIIQEIHSSAQPLDPGGQAATLVGWMGSSRLP